MKLSRIIELALIHYYGRTGNRHDFMCHAVEHMQEVLDLITKDQCLSTKESIQELLDSIDKGSSALVSALFQAGYVEEDRANDTTMAYTTQLYVWWVFDLKNKGL